MPLGFATVHHCSSQSIDIGSIDLATTTPSIWTLRVVVSPDRDAALTARRWRLYWYHVIYLEAIAIQQCSLLVYTLVMAFVSPPFVFFLSFLSPSVHGYPHAYFTFLNLPFASLLISLTYSFNF